MEIQRQEAKVLKQRGKLSPPDSPGLELRSGAQVWSSNINGRELTLTGDCSSKNRRKGQRASEGGEKDGDTGRQLRAVSRGKNDP
jgi:hypothetical protein